MPRPLAFLIALALGLMAVGSAGIALPLDDIRFTLDLSRDHAEVRLTLNDARDKGRKGDHHSSSDYPVSDLAGLKPDWARGGPVSFALVRDAGRVDCAGTARAAHAEGTCRFTADRGLSDLLAASGMARPTEEEAYAMTLIGVRRALLDALIAGHYPMPGIDDFIAMSAVGVTPDFLRELAATGYARLEPEQLIQMAALRIDPAFIRGFERIGYKNLPVETLVQLRALDVTPQFVELVRRDSMGDLSIDQLVKLKVIGFRPAAAAH
ncbi:hypothetical protein [Sphingobium nicotianae]|uniref:Uncharacterized protein n=1 Tax=Sphingobium nicotianae TaxID=2782607 RepID=A0A9X1IRA3_9SPHN|nr:hypothetical protein [Sphingobium nicotianae]MBT2187303.1 hypothetical protein [Sphingobium nicotianae]